MYIKGNAGSIYFNLIVCIETERAETRVNTRTPKQVEAHSPT